MYAGLTIAYIGGIGLMNSYWPLIYLPVILAVITRFVIAREEEYLESRFGSFYLTYKARVRRWM